MNACSGTPGSAVTALRPSIVAGCERSQIPVIFEVKTVSHLHTHIKVVKTRNIETIKSAVTSTFSTC